MADIAAVVSVVCLAGGVPATMALVGLYRMGEDDADSATAPGAGDTQLAVVVEPHAVGLRFSSDANTDYLLQINNQAASGPWTNAPFTIHGTGNEITVFDPDGYSTQKTYQILALPP